MQDHDDDQGFERLMQRGIGRRGFLGLGAAAAAYAGLPFSDARAQGKPKEGGVLRLSAPANPSSLDPARGVSGYDHVILYPMYDTLTEWDYTTLEPRPGLAKAWKFTTPTTLVLDLQDGVKFHDGTPFNAEAVKINIDRGKTDKRVSITSDLVSIDSVEVTGPLQVTIKLKHPDTALLGVLSDRPGMMISPKAIAEQGENSGRNPVGTGAYTFVNWTDRAKVTMKRNENYWRADRSYPDSIEFAIIPEINTGLRSVVAGENDLVFGLTAQHKPIVDRASSLKSVFGPTLIVHMFYFNYKRGPFGDVRVRQAFNYAVDRESFAKATQDGEATRCILPKEHWAYSPDSAKTYPYNPDKAKQLLAEAGFKDGLDVTAIGWNDQKSVQRQEILVEQLGKVGLRVKFQTAPLADSVNLFFTEKKSDIFLGTFTGRPDPSQIYLRLFDPGSIMNSARFDPVPERAAAQNETSASTDLADRKKAFIKLDKIINENALCAPLVTAYDLTAFNGKVVGYRPNLTGKPKFEGVYITS